MGEVARCLILAQAPASRAIFISLYGNPLRPASNNHFHHVNGILKHGLYLHLIN